jgi:hypothetical protein
VDEVVVVLAEKKEEADRGGREDGTAGLVVVERGHCMK